MEIFWCSTKFLGLAQNVHLLSVWPKTFGPAHNILGPVEGPDINKWFILPFTQKICLLGDDVSKFPYDGLKKSCSDKIEMSFSSRRFLQKTDERIQFYYYETCFCSVFGGNWRHQRAISKFSDL